MHARSPAKGLVIGLLLSTLLWVAGCRIFGEGLIAVHDSIDEVRGTTNDSGRVTCK